MTRIFRIKRYNSRSGFYGLMKRIDRERSHEVEISSIEISKLKNNNNKPSKN